MLSATSFSAQSSCYIRLFIVLSSVTIVALTSGRVNDVAGVRRDGDLTMSTSCCPRSLLFHCPLERDKRYQ